ncbi:MAG: segregation/condensation protein A [Clostridia bacterium]|nr:segregation/condensation protein A [Clostridia bacterium]
MAVFLNSTLEDVKFHIENKAFDGPIDLLVNMVREAKINVLEIFVSDITRQYVEYVNNLKELDYEYVAQYITMAATLIEIKASKVLPVDEDDVYTNELQETERQLVSDVEKRLLLTFPEKLRTRETLNLFYNEPQYDESDYKLVAKNLTIEKLLDAYKIVLEQIEYHSTDNEPKTIKKERFTVADKVKEIAGRVRTEKKVRFFDLFEKNFTKLEVINVFLAILELVKKQVAQAKQEEDGDITIEQHPDDIDNAIKQNDEELVKDVEEYD